MKSYFNNTRIAAVVTISIDSVSQESEENLAIGEPGDDAVMLPVKAVLGIHDVIVAPGKELRVSEGTLATFIAVRSAP